MTPKDFILTVILFSIFIAIIYIYSKVSESSNKYTICKIIGYSSDSDGYKYADYEYFVGGRRYIESISYETQGFNKPKIGRRFYVSFVEEYPSFSSIHMDKTVPDSIIHIPKNGWYRSDKNSIFLE